MTRYRRSVRDLRREMKGGLQADVLHTPVRVNPRDRLSKAAFSTVEYGLNTNNTNPHSTVLQIANPTYSIAWKIRNALDPSRAPSKPKTRADFSEEEIRAMEQLYRKSK